MCTEADLSCLSSSAKLGFYCRVLSASIFYGSHLSYLITFIAFCLEPYCETSKLMNSR